MLEVYISENTFTNKKKPYIFRSRNLITYTQEDIIQEIGMSGTTFTAADAAGLLAELEEVFTKYIKSGAAVKLFMGTFRAAASGTAESANETFRPQKGRDHRTPVRDHRISLHFEKDQQFSEALRNMKFNRLGLKKLCLPYISHIENGIIGKTNTFQPGDSVLIKGRFLKFDYCNSNQGLFFKNTETGQIFRATSFTKLTRLSVQALIPSELQDGVYSVYIKTDENKLSNPVKIKVTTKYF